MMADDLPDDISPEDLKELEAANKREIRDFFDKELGKRVSNLQRVFDEGFENEAWLLAFCYVEGIAKWVYELKRRKDWRDNKSEFVEIVTAYGEEESLSSTVAENIYKWFRNPLVHQLGYVRAQLTFGDKRFEGMPDNYWFPVQIQPPVKFEVFYRALKRIIDAAKGISLDTMKYFGTVDP